MNLLHRTRRILDAITEAREHLAAYGDNSWVTIDHHGPPDEVRKAVDGHIAMMEAIRTFARACVELEFHIHRGVDAIDPNAAAELRTEPSTSRHTAALDRTHEHRLSEDFTWKRPCALRWQERWVHDLTTWKAIYSWVMSEVAQFYPDVLSSLPDGPHAASRRGRVMFARNPDNMIAPMLIGTLCYETNLSANGIAAQIDSLRSMCGLAPEEIGVHLREDRDAPGD
jgi:hypothetical protein